jgi:hypothetical protein
LKWIESLWDQYKLGLGASIKKIGPNGLFYVTLTADYAREGQGKENIAANSLLYGVLMSGAYLAKDLNDTTAEATFESLAVKLKVAINSNLWNESRGAYHDNLENTSLFPQDGNAFAVMFNVTTSIQQSKQISAYLQTNWNEFGSRTPEWNNNIGTFPGSAEVHAHFIAGEGERGIALIKRQWGYMLGNVNSTQSTFWEGYSSDGTFNYNGIYMSHAHGWATGPTSAITFYTLGIIPVSPAGLRYRVTPLPSGLSSSQGQLSLDSTGGRYVKVQWDVHSVNTVVTIMTVTVDSTLNTGSSGTLGVPLLLSSGFHICSMEVNGLVVWRSSASMSQRLDHINVEDLFVTITEANPGIYELKGVYTNTSECTDFRHHEGAEATSIM